MNNYEEKPTKDFVDYNEKWSYPLQWIEETRAARYEYQRLLHRVNKAMLGQPSRNLYREEVESNLRGIEMSDEDRSRCLNVPEGKSFALSQAVDTIANQMSGGVDTYEYQIDDPYMLIDDDTEELLAAKCEQDYVENKLDLFAPTFSRDLKKYGLAAVMVSYNPEDDTNDIFRINPKNTWVDTMYSSTGKERFRGYSTMIPFSDVLKMIEHDKDELNLNIEVPDRSVLNKNGVPDPRIKIGRKKISDLNDLAIYIEDINKLATSSSLNGNLAEYWEYAHDLGNCYNSSFYQTYATDPVQRTKNGYHGDDVELTIMYDMTRGIEFKIINRRFVISVNEHAFRRMIAFPIKNPIDGSEHYRIDEFKLKCPLKFQFEDQENRDYFPYPTSNLFPLLDLHDQLCALRAKREHVVKILSILRIESNAADADSLRKTLNIMGVILDDIEGEVNTINFSYNFEPIDSQIAYLEQCIQDKLNAFNTFDAMQSMGDRASAAESGMATGAVAQGLATHQNAIMNLYSEIASQCIGNRVVYSPRSEFPIKNIGGYSAVTIQQMALNAVIRVKSKMARKVAERTIASNALTFLGTMRGMLNETGLAYFAEQALMGQVPRKLAATFFIEQGPSAQEIANATLAGQNTAQMLQQNEQAYMNNPLPYEADNVMQNMSSEDIDSVIAGLNQANVSSENMPDMNLNEAESLSGFTPESGGEFANQESFGEGVL